MINLNVNIDDWATPVFPVGRIGRLKSGTRFLVLDKQEHDGRPGECFAIIAEGSPVLGDMCQDANGVWVEAALRDLKVGQIYHYSRVVRLSYSKDHQTTLLEEIEWE